MLGYYNLLVMRNPGQIPANLSDADYKIAFQGRSNCLLPSLNLRAVAPRSRAVDAFLDFEATGSRHPLPAAVSNPRNVQNLDLEEGPAPPEDSQPTSSDSSADSSDRLGASVDTHADTRGLNWTMSARKLRWTSSLPCMARD